MKKLCYLIFVLVGLFSVSSCCSLKKLRTVTTTTTLVQVDTVLIIKLDTVTITKSALVTDTLYIENTTAKVRVYYDIMKGKLTGQLTGKVFNVPLTIYKRTVTVADVKERIPTKQFQWKFWLLLLIITTAGAAYVYTKFIKNENKKI